MKKALLALVGATILTGCGGLRQEPAVTLTPAAPGPASLVVTMGEEGQLAFYPTELNVRKGEAVKLVLNNADTAQAHAFVIRELTLKSRAVAPGMSETLTFVPDKAGDFAFFCDMPGHKEAGMVGRIHVEP